MRSFCLLFTACALFIMVAAIDPQAQDGADRLVALERNIDQGKYLKDTTDRDLHQFWDAFKSVKERFESFFDALICSAPDQLRELYEEMKKLSEKVDTSHKLKQEQLEELKKILHDQKWTDTGLSTGNDKVDDECKGLDEYIKKANETATDEEEEIKEHIKEVEDAKEKMDKHPCPCVWSPWTEWNECSKTCESGSRQRERNVEKKAINNGAECEGEAVEEEVCNEVCCPVDCKWGNWEAWGDCPSGCDQEKTRVRQKVVEASCHGMECEGNDYEKQICSREEELADQVRALLDENEVRGKNKCRALPGQEKYEMCGTQGCKPCPDDVKCALTPIGNLDSDMHKDDLAPCPTGYTLDSYKEFDQVLSLYKLYLKVCKEI